MSARRSLAAVAGEPPADDEPQHGAGEVIRARPIKVSAALLPQPYYRLVEFCTNASRVMGVRVTHVDVLRCLVDELVDTDPSGLAERVVARLKAKNRL